MASLVLACLGAGAARADGDPVKGKAAFVRQCAICHTVDKGGENRLGPNLFGILGNKAGTVPGYVYTDAFKRQANWEWTADAMGGWDNVSLHHDTRHRHGGFPGHCRTRSRRSRCLFGNLEVTLCRQPWLPRG
jgi:Cytochrome c